MAHELTIKDKLKQWGVVRHTPILGRDGQLNPFYCEIKEQYGNPERLQYLADALWDVIPTKPDCVAAGGYGGIPLAVSIALLHRVKLTLVRDNPKSHGKGGLVEGYVPGAPDSVVVVDDKIVTGHSLAILSQVLKSRGVKVISAYVIVDAREKRDDSTIRSLVSANELIS
jgi:orotate phosphoribosyltransferase